ncbi:general stress protein 13 [Chryseomicrobium aureum]|uniref:S1 domain-containing post-transcriptional regulator GSP13 n=1 Tax=Chryseomicrobium aureum TaxID=1441723 RepID=UPI001957BF29|nr:S1 domain-containing post-transcriptional regulator GSP13 [Chryseomicrobium aureum]MBM7707710.1 general stress protein 13 [Chryseomicrobium aureum]
MKNYKVGDVVTGIVTGIQPYGAFVSLSDDTQGLIHISEITYGYVRDINDFLQVGQAVKVKVLEIDKKESKISLSLRALQDRPFYHKRDDKGRIPLQERIDEQDAGGFDTLKSKLDGWIRKSLK